MALLELDDAINRIARSCEGRTPPDTPFFFLVGAGISAPIVKTAAAIQHELRTQALAGNPALVAPDSDPMSAYAFWLEEALPSRELRRRYFERLIRDQRISSANYRLAMLLLDGKVANVVVTPNFDDFLSRALTLFGRQHIVCDHPLAAERIHFSKGEIQIVHVHGTYWFYTLANRPSEAREWENDKGSAFTTIPRRLGDLLFNRSPLVIGYSGWERDVIMRQLLQRLGTPAHPHPLEHPLFWFCYSEDALAGVHPTLRSHPDVHLVVSRALKAKLEGKTVSTAAAPLMQQPALAGASGNTPGAPGISEAGVNAAASSQALVAGARRQMASESAAETLSADLVLRRLQQKIAPATPRLLSDPLLYFKEQLSNAFPPDAESDANDVLRFGFTVRRVERAMQSAEYRFEELLAPLVDHFRAARYDEVLGTAATLRFDEALAQQQLELADLVFDAANERDDDDARTRDGFRLAERIYTPLADRGALSEEQRVKLCRALFRIAGISHALQDGATAAEAQTRLLARFGEERGEAYNRMVAVTMMVCAAAYQERGELADATQCLRELDRRYHDCTTEDVPFVVASALALRGYTEMARGNLHESRAAFAALEERFSNATDERIRTMVANASTARQSP